MNKLLLPLLLALGCTPGRLADDPGLPDTGPSDLSQAADLAQAADLPLRWGRVARAGQPGDGEPSRHPRPRGKRCLGGR